jgi:NTE family protein
MAPMNATAKLPAASRLGLVLTAGGARGAYQAGVLRRIGEIPRLRSAASPFPIVTGASAGAINGALVAATSSSFHHGTQQLAQLWSQLNVSDVFRADLRALGGNGLRFAAELALGGLIGAGRTQSLVDAAPLRSYLARQLPVGGIADAIDRGDLYAVAITAAGYHSGKAFTFIQGRPGHAVWTKSRRVALPAELTVDHICASAAIPIVFPPVALSAGSSTAYFGDGALRLVTPLSPAIRLGADRLFAIGVRCQEAADALLRNELSLPQDGGEPVPLRRPPLSQICGVFLNAIFLDHLDADLDHLVRMNELVAAYQQATHRHQVTLPTLREPMRIVTPLVLSPSEDLAIVAKTFAHRMPRSIRYLLDGLGAPDAQSADLMSYLLFDSAYTRELVHIGYRDAERRIAEIEAFLLAPVRAPA